MAKASAGDSGRELGRGRGWPKTWAGMNIQSCAVVLPRVRHGEGFGKYKHYRIRVADLVGLPAAFVMVLEGGSGHRGGSLGYTQTRRSSSGAEEVKNVGYRDQ